MKLCIFGSRTLTNPTIYTDIIKPHILKYYPIENIDYIVSGMANGVDLFGVTFANEFNLGLVKFPALWALFGNSAGTVRNKQMAEFATHFIGFQLHNSKGTHHMIQTVKKLGKPIVLVKLKTGDINE